MQQALSAIDEEKIHDLLGKAVTDFGAALSSILGYIGIKHGLYRALADSDGLDSAELAKRTVTSERYVREWLINQAAGGYIQYSPETLKYSMTPEQATALTDEMSPYYVGGGFYVIKAMLSAQAKIAEAFTTGGGMLWGDHDPDLFVGTEKFFRPGYAAHLVNEWIPALTGIGEKLLKGAAVADIGCGHGASTVIMAKAFPNSEFFGFDIHPASIDAARENAEEAGVSNRVHFEVSGATEFPGEGYSLVCFFDCLHDMGNPVGAMMRAFHTLEDEGSVLVVEPMAGNSIEENFNPVGRTFSAASTLCCTPNAIAQGGEALGAVATDDALKKVAKDALFSQFRRCAETPFNRVFEARK